MLKSLLVITIGLLLFSSCSNDSESENPYSAFFFPYDKEVKIYVYRDVKHGLNEKFYRVYGIEDSFGKHIVVENYSMDGRITEALNYNLDSLNIMDHMVVDRNKKNTQAILYKNRMFPMTATEQTWFASKFPGFLDSTVILSETKRSLFKSMPYKATVMGESSNTIVTLDTLRLTVLNPFTKSENEMKSVVKSYFSEGYGLTRVHDLNGKADYQLEKILSQEEWLKLIKK